ncbi:hypothetical protein BKA69DRAFT_1040694 [Paraphysoderma sedebokerense]|nr:hypothetical protein BKA69DRAFT_1040694 [Paraphysoderma sedebokerense]
MLSSILSTAYDKGLYDFPNSPVAAVIPKSFQPKQKVRIVIIGFSVAGLKTVQNLIHQFPPQCIDITVVDPSPVYYVGTAITKALVNPGFEKLLFVPWQRYLQEWQGQGYVINLIQGWVKNVYQGYVDIQISDEFGSGDKVTESQPKAQYDYLIIATGVGYPMPFRPTLKEYSSSSNFVERFQSSIRSYQQFLADESTEKVLLLGAGVVGIELATEMKEVYQSKTVTMVNSSSTKDLLNGFKSSILSKAATKEVEKMGVEVRHCKKTKLIRSEDNKQEWTVDEFLSEVMINAIEKRKTGNKWIAVSEDGTEIEFNLLVICYNERRPIASIPPPSSLSPSDPILTFNQSKGPQIIPVSDTLQLHDCPNIYAVGDVNDTKVAKCVVAATRQCDLACSNLTRQIIHSWSIQCVPIRQPNLSAYKPVALLLIYLSHRLTILHLSLPRNIAFSNPPLPIQNQFLNWFKGRDLLVRRHWHELGVWDEFEDLCNKDDRVRNLVGLSIIEAMVMRVLYSVLK